MDNDQQTEQWFLDRLGKVTASCVSQVMAKGGGATRKNYMMKLLCERLTGSREEGFTNGAMQRGTDLEPVARSAYEINTGLITAETGFLVHPGLSGFGASPDALVGNDGLLEIKCPNTAQHIDTLRNDKIKGEYMWQMRAQMACANRDWCDFVSFDDRLPEALQYHCIRVYRDASIEEEMLSEITKFLSDLDALEADLNLMMEKKRG